MGTLVGVVLFVVLLLLAIGFHEFGHFITARWSGIKVSRFFIGFGPTLWSTRRGRTEVVEDEESGELTERPETEYGVKALPLGGFVKILGMGTFDLPEDLPPEDRPRSFQAAPAWKRAIVLAAGSVTHFILAFVVLFVMFTLVGLPGGPAQPTVSQVEQEVEGRPSPASEAGLRPGDEIVAVDGEGVAEWSQLVETVQANPGERLSLTIVRDGDRRELTITPAAVEEEGERIGLIGVFPTAATERIGPVDGLLRSGGTIGDVVVAVVQIAPEAFSPENLGLVPGQEPSDQRGVSVVGAGQISADLIGSGQFALFLGLFAQINIFIALFNLLPLPPLDGGHLLVLGIEKVRGKAVSPRALLPVMAIVTSLLIALAALLVFQDIVSPVQLPQ